MLIKPGKKYKNRELGNVVRIISGDDVSVEVEDIETYEILELRMSTFEQEFTEC